MKKRAVRKKRTRRSQQTSKSNAACGVSDLTDLCSLLRKVFSGEENRKERAQRARGGLGGRRRDGCIRTLWVRLVAATTLSNAISYLWPNSIHPSIPVSPRSCRSQPAFCSHPSYRSSDGRLLPRSPARASTSTPRPSSSASSARDSAGSRPPESWAHWQRLVGTRTPRSQVKVVLR